jgi:hypothetical protein
VIASITMVELSLLFFLVLFLGIVARLVFSRSQRWKEDAQIPLKDTIEMERDEGSMSEGVRK